MKETYKQLFAGHYESNNFVIKKNHTTGTWVLIRKADKKRRFFPTLKGAKDYTNQINKEEASWII